MRFPKLPVPEAYPSDEPREQLCINHDWVVVMLSIMDRLRYPASWKEVSDETQLESKVLELAKMLVEAKAMGCGCGCGETDNPTRINEDGELEVFDPVTGEWIPFPQGDPRQTATLAPPLPGADGDDKKCQAANNATQHLKDLADKLIADSGAWGNISQLVAALIGILIFLGIIGTAGALTPLLLGLAGILLTTGQAAFQAAMTASVYDTLNCIIYCNINPDASFTDAQIANIKAEIKDQLTGVAATFLHDNVGILGKIGMANAARTQNSRTFDCSVCECGCADGCDEEGMGYNFNDAAWIQHGDYTRYSASTPPGSFDSFDLASVDAILDLGEMKCITAVSITINSGCPPGESAGIELVINGVSRGTIIPLDRAPLDPGDCSVNPSAVWTIEHGVESDQITFAQVGTPCPGGYGNLVICARVVTCV